MRANELTLALLNSYTRINNSLENLQFEQSKQKTTQQKCQLFPECFIMRVLFTIKKKKKSAFNVFFCFFFLILKAIHNNYVNENQTINQNMFLKLNFNLKFRKETNKRNESTA